MARNKPPRDRAPIDWPVLIALMLSGVGAAALLGFWAGWVLA